MTTIELHFGKLVITPAVKDKLLDLNYTPNSLAEAVKEHGSKCDGNPSIYCGTYAKYNDGSLQGMWIDLTTFGDVEELNNFCEAIHADEEWPELDIQDYEGLPAGLDGDEVLTEDGYQKLQDYLEACEKYDVDAVDAYLNIFSLDDLDEFEERYLGEFDSEEAYAEHFIEETYDLKTRMGSLAIYIDYSAYARNLFSEGYSFEDGYVFYCG